MTVESAVVEFREEQKKTNARLDAMQTDLLQICDQMGHLSQQAKDLCEMVKVQLAVTKAVVGLEPDS